MHKAKKAQSTGKREPCLKNLQTHRTLYNSKQKDKHKHAIVTHIQKKKKMKVLFCKKKKKSFGISIFLNSPKLEIPIAHYTKIPLQKK